MHTFLSPHNLRPCLFAKVKNFSCISGLHGCSRKGWYGTRLSAPRLLPFFLLILLAGATKYEVCMHVGNLYSTDPLSWAADNKKDKGLMQSLLFVLFLFCFALCTPPVCLELPLFAYEGSAHDAGPKSLCRLWPLGMNGWPLRERAHATTPCVPRLSFPFTRIQMASRRNKASRVLILFAFY